MNLKIDPEFQNLTPPLREDESTGLHNSIKKHGCREALSESTEDIIIMGICKSGNMGADGSCVLETLYQPDEGFYTGNRIMCKKQECEQGQYLPKVDEIELVTPARLLKMWMDENNKVLFKRFLADGVFDG